MATQFDGNYSVCEIGIKRDEDWNDTVTLQRLMADGTTSNFDFSAVLQIDLYIRPTYDHSTLVKRLSSSLAFGGIVFDPAVTGMLQIFVSRADVIASIPTGTWSQFLVGTNNAGGTFEFWRGPLHVYPGNTA